MPLDDKAIKAMTAKVGPDAVKFVEYLSGEFWLRVCTTAVDMGFDDEEAAAIARVTAAGAARSMASAVENVRQARAFLAKH